MICPLTEKYLDKVVKVHLESFPGFFLTFLGAKFLRLFYEGVINYQESIKLIYLNDNEVNGFIVGIMNPSGFYTTLLKRDWFRFGIASTPALLRKPKAFFRLIRAVAKPGKTPKDPGVAELSSLAVLPDSQGKGVGKELVTAFIRELRNRGGRALYLTTDACNNDPVNKFYEKMGFKIRQVIKTHENRYMNEYWLELKQNINI